MSECVRIEYLDAVARVTLNRPATLNALDSEMTYRLRDLFAQLADDTDIRSIVLRGEGQHFMSGGDIAFFQQSLALSTQAREAKVSELVGVVNEFVTHMRTMPQPVIASVRGNAAGFGMSLLAACDLAIAADNALFTQAYTQIGTTPDGGNTFFLPRAVGIKRAMAMTLLNEPLSADQVLAMGLVNQVVPDEQLDEVSLSLARRLAKGPTQAYARVKQLMNGTMGHTLQQQLDAEQSSFTNCTLESDFAEGITAFMQKRKPEFSGR